MNRIRVEARFLFAVTLLISLLAPTTTTYASPSALVATTVSSTEVDLTWDLTAQGGPVTVSRCAGVGCSPTDFVTSSEGATGTFADTNLTPGTTYHYQANGNSGFFMTYGGFPVITDVTYHTAGAVAGISPSSGSTAGGTSVTLAGYALGNAGAVGVSFGTAAGTNVSTVLVNDFIPGVGQDNYPYQVTVAGPAHAAGVVHVTVTTNGGTSATSSADQFTYIAPQPAVSGISPATGRPGGGTTVTLTGSGMTGATAVNFGDEAATNVTVNSDNSISVISPAGVGKVDVTVTTAGGTSATSAADLFNYATPFAVVGKSGTSFKLSGANFATSATPSVLFTPANGAGSPTTVNTPCATGQTENCIKKDSAKSITVKAPSGPTGLQIVTVDGAGTGATVLYFDYGPAILKVSKAGGAAGTTVVIKGGNFMPDKTTVPTVTFNGTPLPGKCSTLKVNTNCIASASDKSITVKAPSGTASQTIGLTTVNGQADDLTKLGADFSFAGAITSISPQGGAGGTVVHIKGQGFGTSPSVSFGGAPLDSSCATATSHNCIKTSNANSITVVAPDNLTGAPAVTVETAAGDADDQTPAGAVFAYAPAVTSVSPLAGSASTTITIKGVNLGTALPQIAIGGVSTNSTGKCSKTITAPCIVTNNAELIKVKPPTNLSGPQSMTVTIGGTTALNLTAAPLEFNFGADVTGLR